MPDTPAEQATRRPRRTPAVVELEQRLEHERDAGRLVATQLEAARRQHDADVGTILRAVARAEHAERLLTLAVNALGQWRHDDGDLDGIAADALAVIVAEVLGIDPDHRPPRARRDLGLRPGGEIPRHADHPDDDEPPVEP